MAMTKLFVVGVGLAVGVVACSSDEYSQPGEGGPGGSGGSGTVDATGSSGDAGTDGVGGGLGTAGSAGSAGSGGSAEGGGGTPGIPGQSCTGLTTECHGESCCAKPVVPSGTFMMGRSATVSASDYTADGQASEVPEHSVTVSSFTLDKYEVTVGRFRQFLAAYEAGWRPVDGDGAHPNIEGSGWDSAWNASLPADGTTLTTNLKCDPSYQTWTNTAGPNEEYPINCVNWYEAMAFCLWDGGRLPTEAEWEYAAAGGSEERLYPWGSALPSVETARANSSYSDASPYIQVGSHPTGAGKWGQEDMAGSMYEWVYDGYQEDWYSTPESRGVDVSCLIAPSYRVRRGGTWGGFDEMLRAAFRDPYLPENRYYRLGFRCAGVP
jgi:sulfatase modifying factor 1